MPSTSSTDFSPPVDFLLERRLPERATPAGYAALIDAYELNVPVPRRLHAIGTRHRIIEENGWRLMTPRHQPDPTLTGHLTLDSFRRRQNGEGFSGEAAGGRAG